MEGALTLQIVEGFSPNEMSAALTTAIRHGDLFGSLILGNGFLIYVLLIKQFVRIRKFRRSTEDKLAIALKLMEAARFDRALHWCRAAGNTLECARIEALILLGKGEIENAWRVKVRELRFSLSEEPTSDEVSFDLWIFAIRFRSLSGSWLAP